VLAIPRDRSQLPGRCQHDVCFLFDREVSSVPIRCTQPAFADGFRTGRKKRVSLVQSVQHTHVPSYVRPYRLPTLFHEPVLPSYHRVSVTVLLSATVATGDAGSTPLSVRSSYSLLDMFTH